MFMTERFAGSDVGATATRAVPQSGDHWLLYGDKWFCSNADADLALVLARPEGAPAAPPGSACSCCRACCRRASPTATASCG